MFNPISFSNKVQAGDTLQFQFAFTCAYWPSVDAIQTAMEAVPDFNVTGVVYDTISGQIFGNSGQITGVVANTGGNSTGVTDAASISEDIKTVLSHFPTVYGAQINGVGKQDSSVGSILKNILGVDPTTAPSASTTISLAAIAIVAVVILVVFLKLD